MINKKLEDLIWAELVANSGGSSIVGIIFIIIQKCLAAISFTHSTSLYIQFGLTHTPTCRNVSAWSSASNWSISEFFYFLFFSFFVFLWANDRQDKNKDNGQSYLKGIDLTCEESNDGTQRK
jgi:hypothetical protein